MVRQAAADNQPPPNSTGPSPSPQRGSALLSRGGSAALLSAVGSPMISISAGRRPTGRINGGASSKELTAIDAATPVTSTHEVGPPRLANPIQTDASLRASRAGAHSVLSSSPGSVNQSPDSHAMFPPASGAQTASGRWGNFASRVAFLREPAYHAGSDRCFPRQSGNQPARHTTTTETTHQHRRTYSADGDASSGRAAGPAAGDEFAPAAHRTSTLMASSSEPPRSALIAPPSSRIRHVSRAGAASSGGGSGAAADGANSAMHLIPWDQRIAHPEKGSSDACSCWNAPRFWSRMDWAIRVTVGMLPLVVVAMLPSARSFFTEFGLVCEMFIWIAGRNLGASIIEAIYAVKAFAIALSMVVVVMYTGAATQFGGFICVYGFGIFLIVALGDTSWKTVAFVYAMFLYGLYYRPGTITVAYIGYFLRDFSIGIAMAVGVLLLPKPKLAIEEAEGVLFTAGNLLSAGVQGVSTSIWCPRSERRLNRQRLFELRASVAMASQRAASLLSNAEYEPISGYRLDRSKHIHHLLQDLSHLFFQLCSIIERIEDTDVKMDRDATLRTFGAELQEPLAMMLSTLDSAILKIFDSDVYVTEADLLYFTSNLSSFYQQLYRVRQNAFNGWNESNFIESTLIGTYLFQLESIFTRISAFQEPEPTDWAVVKGGWCGGCLAATCQTILVWVVRPAIADVYFVTGRAKSLLTLFSDERGMIVAKNAIRMALAMSVSVSLQYFTGSSELISRSHIIPFVAQQTSGNSFLYLTGRLQGIVFSSVLTYLLHLFVGGQLIVLASLLIVEVFGFGYIQSSSAVLGSQGLFTICNMLIPGSIASAAQSISTNVVAVLIYFVFALVLWPTFPRAMLDVSLSAALASMRGSSTALLSMLHHLSRGQHKAANLSGVGGGDGSAPMTAAASVEDFEAEESGCSPDEPGAQNADCPAGGVAGNPSFDDASSVVSLSDEDASAAVTDVLTLFRSEIDRQEGMFPAAVAAPTMVGADFPLEHFLRIARIEWNLYHSLVSLQSALRTLRQAAADDSSHYPIIRAITRPTGELSDLILGMLDLLQLMVNRTAPVMMQHVVSRFDDTARQVMRRVFRNFWRALARTRGSNQVLRLDHLVMHASEGFIMTLQSLVSEVSALQRALFQLAHFEVLQSQM